MAEHIQWRVEEYRDDDPFVSVQWYVIQGSIVIAQCEIGEHAERILLEHVQKLTYEQVLRQIAAMSGGGHSLDEAVGLAKRALEAAG
jgi:hypothetical protein